MSALHDTRDSFHNRNIHITTQGIVMFEISQSLTSSTCVLILCMFNSLCVMMCTHTELVIKESC